MPQKSRSSIIKNVDVAAATFVVGSDLEVADFTNIQTAVDNLPATGGSIAILDGTFALPGALAFSAKPVRLVGAGRGATIVDLGANAISGTERVELIGIEFVGIAGSSISLGSGSLSAFIEDCSFSGIPTLTLSGVSSKILACSFSVTEVIGPAQQLTVVACMFSGGGKLTLTGAKPKVVSCDFDGSLVATFGISIGAAVDATVIGCRFNNQTSGGISVAGTNSAVTGCRFLEPGGTPPILESGAANSNRYANNVGFNGSTIIGPDSVVNGAKKKGVAAGATTGAFVSQFTHTNPKGVLGTGTVKNTGGVNALEVREEVTDAFGTVTTLTTTVAFGDSYLLDPAVNLGTGRPPYTSYGVSVRHPAAATNFNLQFTSQGAME